MGEEHVLAVTKLVNMLLGKPAAALLSFLHIDRIHEVNAQYPIPNFMAMELVLFLFAAVFFLWLKARISVDRPGATQQVMEMVLTNPMGLGIEDLLEDVVGHGASRYLPMLGTITLFVLMSNLLVLIPGFMSPTAEKTVVHLLQPFRHWKARRGRVRQDSARTSALHCSHYDNRGDHQPFREGTLVDGPALGQHDGGRADLRYLPRPHRRTVCLHHPAQRGRLPRRRGPSGDSASSFAIPYF